VAPFPLLTYNDTAKRANLIAAVTAKSYMPPWNAEPGYGHFADERRLTEAQIEMIREWARSEEPEGDPREKSAPPRFASGWRAGYFALAGPVTFSGRGGRVFRHG